MTGNPRFKSQQKPEILLSSETSRPMGPTQPHIKWVPGALTSGAKTFECENDHSPSSRVEVRNVWSCISTLTIHLNGLLWGFNFTLSDTTKYTQKYKVQYAAFARTILKNEKTTVLQQWQPGNSRNLRKSWMI